MEFLDTNPIIRFLTKDHPEHGPRARALFQQLASGTASVITREGVIVESVQVLSSKSLYNLPREEIRDKLSPILDLPGLRPAQREVYQRALEL